MKKILSVLLSIIMLFTLLAPCACAASGYYSNTPIIVLHGLGREIIGRDGNVDYDGSDKVKDALLNEEFLDLLGAELLLSEMTGNWQPYADLIYDTLTPCFANAQLEDNGECYPTKDGKTYTWSWSYNSLPGATGSYHTDRYDYHIDWRLDPMAIARDFSDYVDAVLRKTGADKVKLFVRCMGSNVFFSYLAQYEEAYNKISDVCFYIPASKGIDFVGAIFSGQIEIESENVDKWLSYILSKADNLDPTIADLAAATVSFLDFVKGLGLATDELNHIIDEVRDILIPRLVMSSFGTYPGYWGMIGEEYFYDAVDFIFSYKDYETKYAGLIEKITTFDTKVRKNMDSMLDKLEATGVNVSVVAKYNTPTFPFYEGCEITGDGTALISPLSFGATGGAYFIPLGDYYLQNVIGTNREKYLSPDNMIDASTARFPDTTWFIKNCSHGVSPDNLYDMADYILGDNVTNGRVTVFTDTENWGQYLGYNEETQMIISYKDETTNNEDNHKENSNNPFEAIIRFFTKIMEFFSKFFKGEISFGNLFGKEK